MRTKKSILKINSEGVLVEYNTRLKRFEYSSRPWSWDDITPGYKRESRKNYKANSKKKNIFKKEG